MLAAEKQNPVEIVLPIVLRHTTKLVLHAAVAREDRQKAIETANGKRVTPIAAVAAAAQTGVWS